MNVDIESFSDSKYAYAIFMYNFQLTLTFRATTQLYEITIMLSCRGYVLPLHVRLSLNCISFSASNSYFCRRLAVGSERGIDIVELFGRYLSLP